MFLLHFCLPLAGCYINILCSLLTWLSFQTSTYLSLWRSRSSANPVSQSLSLTFLTRWQNTWDRDLSYVYVGTRSDQQRVGGPAFMNGIGTTWRKFALYTEKLQLDCIPQFGGFKPLGGRRPNFFIMGRNGSDMLFWLSRRRKKRRTIFFFFPVTSKKKPELCLKWVLGILAAGNGSQENEKRNKIKE